MSQGFVGRAEELAAIEELLADARRERRASALLVVGEPGMGKSRLLAEAEDRHRDGAILRFAGYEPESTVPLAAAAPLLRRIAAASEDRNFHGLLDAGADTGGLDAIRIFESVHRQLARLQPAALFVDDLQWVDPVSIALCHYLARAIDGSGRGLALVIASRPAPVVEQLATSLATVVGEDRRPATLLLRPLGRAAGVRFVMDRTGSLERREAVELWERSGGSPFWLDVLVDARGDETDIDAVVGSRIAALTADAKHLLTILAILGRPTDAIELERLVEWLQPGAVCFVGLAGWRAAVDRRAIAGPQPDGIGGRPAYVMPSTSGLNARTPPSELADHLRAALALSRTSAS